MSELAARSNHRDGDALQVAVGDGVASREAEAIVADAITSLPQCGYAIVSEAGPALSALKECARALLAVASGWPQHCCAGTCCVIAATSSASLGAFRLLRAGASVYSASQAARDELGSIDVTLRGAVSIARRCGT